VSSRHADIETLQVCFSPRTTSTDWSTCLEESASTSVPSPIDEFYNKHAGLTALGGFIGNALRADLAPVLADQLLLGYVSATELYFRRLLAATAQICPEVRDNVRDVEIAFGAVDFYPKDGIEYSLTEKITLTEEGKVKSLLVGRFGVSVNGTSSLSRAISQFEKLCHLRHALVHSSGVVNSRNAKSLGHQASRSNCRVSMGENQLQLAAGVCMDLVRSANEEVARHVLWSWVVAGHLRGSKARDRTRLARFRQVFVSTTDVNAGLSALDQDGLHALTKKLIADLASSKLKRAAAG